MRTRPPVLLISTLLLWLIPLLVAGQTPAAPTVEDQWDAILAAHTRSGRIGSVSLNFVDYATISSDGRWPLLLRALETAAEPKDSKGRIAFWSNAYTIMAVKVVLTKYPVESIKDVGGWVTKVWDLEAGVVAWKARTLTEIEHRILRPLGDPRIHAAIVCASVSCPPLRREAFRTDRLDVQLDDQVRVWLGNTESGARVEDNGATLRVSPILKWFAEEFEKLPGGVRGFLDSNLQEAVRAKAASNAKLKYLDYDWSLNDARREVRR